MTSQHLIDLDQLQLSEIQEIILLAKEIRQNPAAYTEEAKGKVMATLFYEPSTRTALSFQTAMIRLGGQAIGFSDPANSSVAKGESLKDTIRVVSGYADLIVMRHPVEGSAKAASLYAQCPVVNAGDGGHLHPTQTLTDVVTISALKGGLSGLTVGLCGDLKHGRTVHSLVKCLSQYPGNHFILISTPFLQLPSYLLDTLQANGCSYTLADRLEDVIDRLDVLYMTRIQRERFASQQEYQSQKGIYVLDGRKMQKAKPDLSVLHPLPKVDEITDEVDDDPRAHYFMQAEYGMYARMALILKMLRQPRLQPDRVPLGTAPHRCGNDNCIVHRESYLPELLSEGGELLVCEYCDGRTPV